MYARVLRSNREFTFLWPIVYTLHASMLSRDMAISYSASSHPLMSTSMQRYYVSQLGRVARTVANYTFHVYL